MRPPPPPLPLVGFCLLVGGFGEKSALGVGSGESAGGGLNSEYKGRTVASKNCNGFNSYHEQTVAVEGPQLQVEVACAVPLSAVRAGRIAGKKEGTYGMPPFQTVPTSS